MSKLTLYILLLSIKCFGQSYSFKKISSYDGLDSPELISVKQDSRGYLWIGAVNGLFKYDGNTFTNYSLLNGNIDNTIHCIKEDKSKKLWLGSNVGIQSFDGKNFKEYQIKDTSVKNFYFLDIIETSDGNIYAGCFIGLFVLNKNNHCFEKVKGLNVNIKELIEDKHGVLWIASDKGLYSYKNKVFTYYEVNATVSNNNLTCINIDKQGILWIGTSAGIVKYNGKVFEKYFESVNSENRILDILVTSDGKIIFTSDCPIIKIYENGNFKSIDATNLVGRASFIRLTQDDRDNIWIASAVGLIKMYTKSFAKYSLSDSIKSPVMNIAMDKQNNLYFATISGLYKQQQQNLLKYNISNNPDEQFITSLLSTDSALLVGSYSGQAYKFTNSKFFPFGNRDYITANPIYQILPNNKELWFCKGYNVVSYKNNKYTVHTFPNLGYTQSALIDSKQRIWFANTGSLMLYENNAFKVIDKNQGYNFKESVTLAEDKNKNIWIGTFGYGIIKYDGKKFSQLTVNDNLISNYISSCIYDKKANTLWLGTSNGVSKISLDELGNVKEIKNFKQEQGLECLGCNQNAIFQLPNNNILFGTENGLYEYNSNSNNRINSSPKLNFTGIRLNYEKQDLVKYSDSILTWNNMPVNLVLPYHNNHITFDFVGINLDASENIKYKYILEGFDNKWNPITKNNTATYSNLASGSYTFKVIASDTNDNWSSQPLTFSFVIKPAFYNTWWFYIFCTITISTISFLFYKWKINTLKKQQNEKLNQLRKIAESELKAIRSQLNPHFMFNVLNNIQDVYLDRNEEKAQLYIVQFASLIRELLQNSSKKEIPLSEEIEFIKKYIELEKLRLANRFDYNIKVSDNIDITDTYIPPMLLQPFIENAINYGLSPKTEKGHLEISFEKVGNNIEIKITDNGIGRKASELSKTKKHHTSMAIALISERLEILNSINNKINYHFTITDLYNNNLPNGTQVTLIIPNN